MTFRSVLLGVGILFMMAGISLIFVWLSAVRNPPVVPQQPEQNVEVMPQQPPEPRKVLAAAHFLPTGKLLREEDFSWKKIMPEENLNGTLLEGSIAKSNFVGAILNRDFAQGEAILESELVKPGDEKFFTSVLKPGGRAVSIFVDTVQINAGLVLPGDHVDVILTQTFNDDIKNNNETNLHYKNVVGETVLRNVRVIALDQTLQRLKSGDAPSKGQAADQRVPKTVTLELFGSDPESLMVASETGKLQLAVLRIDNAEPALTEDKRLGRFQSQRKGFDKILYRPAIKRLPAAHLEGQMEKPDGGNTRYVPVWSSDISAALRNRIALANPLLPSSTGSTLENLIRRPLVTSRNSLIAAPQALTPKSSGRSPYDLERRP